MKDLDYTESKKATANNVLFVIMLSIVIIILLVGTVVITRFYKTEATLRLNTVTVVPVNAEILSIEKTESYYSLKIAYETTIGTVRVGTVAKEDGEAEVGNTVQVYLWEFKDGTKLLRKTKDTRTIKDLVINLLERGILT